MVLGLNIFQKKLENLFTRVYTFIFSYEHKKNVKIILKYCQYLRWRSKYCIALFAVGIKKN